MPIPQLEKRQQQNQRPSYARDASSIRKKRAQARAQRQRDAAARNKADDTQGTAKKSRRSRGSLAQKAIKLVFILCVVGVLFGAIGTAFAFAWVSDDLASIEDFDQRVIEESTRIYARDGETLLYEIGDNRRKEVELNQVSTHIQQATLALEDRRFYEHTGFDPLGILRAVVKFRGLETAQGGSTLTQQVVRNTVLTRERALQRKLKELILSIRLEQKYSKDEILELYLNEVYYGANFQGVEIAAQEFFHKPAKDVTLAEAVTLAALPKNPIKMLQNPDRLKERREYGLDIMVEIGYITAEEAEEAKQQEVILDQPHEEIRAPHFVFFVREYLLETYGAASLGRDGLKIITTLDWDKQQKAEKAITDGIPKIEQYGGNNAALVTLDTKTGQVLAMVGSRDYYDKEHDGEVNVVTRLNQPGSSLKPLIYLIGFSKGYIPETRLYDVETDFPIESGVYHPYNFDGKEHGLLTIRTALNQSYNIPAVKMLYLVGVDTLIRTAEKFGYSTFKGREHELGLSMALGGADVTLLEHTGAYATYAREGAYRKPTGLLRVEDRHGDLIEEWKDASQQVFTKDSVRILNSVLSDSAARGSVFARLNLNGRPVAAKTGTSNDFRDAWALGYTPSIATGIWTGRNDNQPMKNLGDGIVIAAPIFQAYMNDVLSGTPVETFQSTTYKAENEALGGDLETTVTYAADSVTGDVIPEECLDTYNPDYITQKEVSEAHTILHYIDKSNPTGPPPTDPSKDPMYKTWEEAVRRYTNSTSVSSLPKSDCNMRSANQQPSVSLTSLINGTSYNRKSFSISGTATPGKNRTVVTVQYVIDAVNVETQTVSLSGTSAVTSSYEPASLTDGKHQVTIKVMDDKGNTASSSVNIDYHKVLRIIDIGEDEVTP